MVGGSVRASVPPESVNGDTREDSVFENETRGKEDARRVNNPATSIAISILTKDLKESGDSAMFLDLASKVRASLNVYTSPVNLTGLAL
jgi:hypothetical protein